MSCYGPREVALRSSLLSPASASLQPGHKLLCRLVLQVAADVAGVGAICMASEQTPTETHTFKGQSRHLYPLVLKVLILI